MKTVSTTQKINELSERLMNFAARIIKIVNELPKTVVGRHVGSQLMRSGTSPGSNYEEACGAESRADFVHKLGIVLKELKETRFWLKLIGRTHLLKSTDLKASLEECEQLCAIVAKSVITAKANGDILN